MKKIIELVKAMCLVAITICFVINIINNNKKENIYDINKDGKVSALDLLILQKYLLEEGEYQCQN